MKHLRSSCLAALLLLVPIAAIAADGFVTGNVNLRAGPDVDYPALTMVPAGTPVSIQGCTQDWAWCDVVVYDDRGWVAGNFIQYDYDNEAVLLPDYGARIGIPIVTFSISTYWDDYYRNRPFYRERTVWYSRRMPHRPPPRPLHRPLRPVHAAPSQRWHAGPRPDYRPPVPQRPTDHRGPPDRASAEQHWQSAGNRTEHRTPSTPHAQSGSEYHAPAAHGQSQSAAHSRPAHAGPKDRGHEHDRGG